jgi:hypothetical protein
MRILLLTMLLLLFSCNREPSAKYYITDKYDYRFYTDEIYDDGSGCIWFESKHGYTEHMKIKICGYYTIIENGKTGNTK